MPLLDHFHPPLSLRRHWHSFHNAWATVLAFDLNRQLPIGYFAEPNVKFGIEIDVAALNEDVNHPAVPDWDFPAPTQTIPLTLATDIVEVLVYNSEAGPVLTGAIELISPANKDRPSHREAFVSKGAFFLQQAIGLIVVDVVTDRQADLHGELLRRLGTDVPSNPCDLWAASYRPTQEKERTQLEIWHRSLKLGDPLPTLLFWLKNGPCLQVNMENTYATTCRELSILDSRNGPGS